MEDGRDMKTVRETEALNWDAVDQGPPQGLEFFNIEKQPLGWDYDASDFSLYIWVNAANPFIQKLPGCSLVTETMRKEMDMTAALLMRVRFWKLVIPPTLTTSPTSYSVSWIQITIMAMKKDSSLNRNEGRHTISIMESMDPLLSG